MEQLLHTLNLQQLIQVQKTADKIIAKNIDNFFVGINMNKIELIETVVHWGLPEKNEVFIQYWGNLEIKNSISIDTLNCLDSALRKNYPTLHASFIHKFKQMFSELFNYSTDKKTKHFFNTSDDSFTDYIEWTIDKYPSVLDNNLKKTFLNSWGKIRFNPKKHAKTEAFVLSYINAPHNCLLNASRVFSKDMLDYFFTSGYLPPMKIDNPPEQFFSQCLDKAINARNLSAIEFWIDKKAPLPKQNGCFTQLIQNTSDNTEILKVLIEYANTPLFNEQILLHTSITLNREKSVRFILENFYRTIEAVDKAKELITNKKNNESMIFLKEYVKYQSLALQLNEKPVQSNRLKI